MKKTPLLNVALSRVIAGMGHGDILVIGDAGLPVPPGFTITTEVCTAFYDNDRQYPAELREQVRVARGEPLAKEALCERRRFRILEHAADLRRLRADELRPLAEELREYLVDTVARGGGHFAAGLGALELTTGNLELALRYLTHYATAREAFDDFRVKFRIG